MIDTSDLEKIVALALCTAYVKGERPLSLLIISDRPEAGKTEVVKQFCGTPGVEFASDVTGYGIKRDFLDKIARGDIHHIIIPELLTPLSKGKVSADSFTSILQVLIEDGVMGFHTGYIDGVWGNKKNEPIKTIGIIGCMPQPFFTERIRLDWMRRGFLSRFVVVTYKYGFDSIEGIFASIREGNYLTAKPTPLDFDGNQADIAIPDNVAAECERLGVDIVKEAVALGLAYGFREVKHIRAMVAANVVLEQVREGTKRTEANMKDFQEIDRLGYLFNRQFNELKVG